ncbi:MAG: hypothetical protein Q9168_001366 [Polycauliona sp. 1 TL-2023]
MSEQEQEDADIREAIRLSLQQEREVIVVDSDATTTDDEEPEPNVAPKSNISAVEVSDGVQSKAGVQPATEPAPISLATMGILGLDRKAMEEERLARKRKASISPPPSRKTMKLTAPDKSTVSSSTHQANHPTKISPSFHFNRKLPYANGAVKKTWAFGHARNKDDIKIEELLQKDDLTLAVLSSFQWDMEWLLRKLKTKTTQLIFVMQAETEDIKAQYRNETASMPNLRLCFPSMAGQVNCMHSKLMLLSYPTHLRVVVPTANLVPYDWGETGTMENAIFLIDLPRLPSNPSTSPKMTDFGDDLIHFLSAMGLEKSIIDSMHHFDFSATADLAFVHTIGGTTTNDSPSWGRTGYCGLGRAVSQLGLATNSPLNIDYITSSVGSLNTEFLSTLYLAAQGDQGLAIYEWRTTPASKRSKIVDRNMQALQQATQEQLTEGFRIYFPSLETVRASTGGPPNGGTICFQENWWNAATFPRELLRDCRSRRDGMLMHNKIIYVYPTSHDPTTSHTSSSTSWAYIGSANCSESAWGRLVKDRQTKLPKLNCRNWECGVIIPFRRAAEMTNRGGVTSSHDNRTTNHKNYEVEEDKAQSGVDGKAKSKTKTKRSSGLKAFDKVMPVPMEYPAKEYSNGEKPWFYSG